MKLVGGFKFCFVLFVALAVSAANAQLSRWRLGGPALILDLPGDPGAGGVKWHESSPYSFFPTSWSGESADLRVEVSSVITDSTLERRADLIATTFSERVDRTSKGKISNCPALYFSVGPRRGVALQDGYRQWIVLAIPKTAVGSTLASTCLSSISVERSGTQRWVRRNLGQTKMNAPLPYELSLEANRGRSDRRNSYELMFDGIEVTSFVETSGEGMKFEFAKTVGDYPNGEKAIPGTENFSSKRTRIKGNGYTGEEVDLEFRRGNKSYFIRTMFIGDENRVARLSIVGDPGNAKHKEYAERILNGLTVSDADFDGLEPRQAGTEGIWIDFPKPLEKENVGGSSFRQYGCLVGNYAADVRVIDKTPGIADNKDQLVDFLEIKFKGEAKEAKDYSVDRGRTMVTGMDARTLRISYSKGGQKTLRYAMAIFGPDRNYVIELIGYASQKDLFERIFDTATVKVEPSVGWRIMPVGESGISMLAPKSIDIKKEAASEEGAESLVTGIIAEDSVFGGVTEIRYKDNAPAPGSMLNRMAKTLFGAMKLEYEIVEQQPFETRSAQGLHAYLLAKANGQSIPADMVILRQGKFLWVLVVISNPNIKQAVINHYSILNSIQ